MFYRNRSLGKTFWFTALVKTFWFTEYRAFAKAKEAGLEDEAAINAIGRRYRDTVLALSGSQHPMDVFKTFRGREPSTKALLKHNGLLTQCCSDKQGK